MGKFEDYIETLRKDKKKGMIAFALVVTFILCIVLGVVMSGGEEPVGEEGVQISSLDVPVDTNSINKGYEYKSAGNGDFFGVDAQSDTIGVEDNGSTNTNVHVANYRQPVYRHSSSVSSTKAITEDHAEPVDVLPERRRRIPSDEAGNMEYGSSKLWRGVVANNNRTVKSGSYVKIRVAEDMSVGGIKLSKNTVVTGVARYGAERMGIVITSVMSGGYNRTVDWLVYDEDGNEGIAVPASVLNDIVTDGADEAIESGGSVSGNVPVVGSVKVNVKKRNKEVSFVITNGHRIYIRKRT